MNNNQKILIAIGAIAVIGAADNAEGLRRARRLAERHAARPVAARIEQASAQPAQVRGGAARTRGDVVSPVRELTIEDLREIARDLLRFEISPELQKSYEALVQKGIADQLEFPAESFGRLIEQYNELVSKLNGK